MGDIRTGNELRDGVHAHYTRPIFQDDNLTVLEDFFLCALNWQNFLGSEDREDKESETNECVDGSHRGGWEPLSFPERVTKEGCEGARLEESSTEGTSNNFMPTAGCCPPVSAVRPRIVRALATAPRGTKGSYHSPMWVDASEIFGLVSSGNCFRETCGEANGSFSNVLRSARSADRRWERIITRATTGTGLGLTGGPVHSRYPAWLLVSRSG